MRSDWRLGHRPSLDALRGIAILAVMGNHFAVPGVSNGGNVGVTLFFVLSGYLITALILGELDGTGRLDLRAFYARRVRRLLPALLVMLGAVAIVTAAAGALREWLPSGLAGLFYVGNWTVLAGWPMTGIGHVWSLAVEEQFYIVWPATLIALLRIGGGRAAIAAALTLIAVSFVVTLFSQQIWTEALYGSLPRAKDLMAGALVALLAMRSGSDVRVPTLAAILSAVILAANAAVFDPAATALTLTVPCAVLVAWFAERPRFATWRWLTGTGRISYGLYLYHFPLKGPPIDAFGALDWLPRAAALTVTSYGLAIASWILLERRVIRRSSRPGDAKVLGVVAHPR